MAYPLFDKLIIGTGEQLSQLVTVMLTRALYEETGSYDSSLMPELWLNAELNLDAIGPGGKWAGEPMTVRDLVTQMKVNLFTADRTSQLISQCLNVNTLTGRLRNAYILTRCSSRLFVESFLASGAYTRKTIRQKLDCVLDYMGTPCFRCMTMSYNPQRRERYALRKHYRLQPQRDRLRFMKMFQTSKGKGLRSFMYVPKLKLKTCRQWRPKAQIAKGIRAFRGIGSFMAKNLWHILQPVLGYPRQLNLTYTDVGPGARVGVNLCMGWPPALLKTCGSEVVGLFYSDAVGQLRKRALKHKLLRFCDNDPTHIAAAKDRCRLELSTLEGMQFFLCEWSKIVRYYWYRGVVYTRGYWRNLEDAS